MSGATTKICDCSLRVSIAPRDSVLDVDIPR